MSSEISHYADRSVHNKPNLLYLKTENERITVP